MSLSQKQQKFTTMVGQLIEWATKNGYGLTFGEAYRTEAQAAQYAQEGKGIAHSLHCKRLAVDFNLFIDGVYQTDSASYSPLGEFWESIGGSWGGRFARVDGNHFSLEHDGIK